MEMRRGSSDGGGIAGHKPHCSEREDAGGSQGRAPTLQSPLPCPGLQAEPLCCQDVPSGFTHLSPPQKTFSPVRTAEFGTAASGICKPTSCTTAPAARAPAPPPPPPSMRSPRSRTPTSASVPSPSAAKAVPAPAPWRSTCVATAVRPQAPQAPHLLNDILCVPKPQLYVWYSHPTTQPPTAPRA